jgi:hypothetical protein
MKGPWSGPAADRFLPAVVAVAVRRLYRRTRARGCYVARTVGVVGALETAAPPADQRQSADSCPFSSVTRLVLRRLQQSRVVW